MKFHLPDNLMLPVKSVVVFAFLFICSPVWSGTVDAKGVSTETPQQEIEKAWSDYYQTVEEIRAAVENSTQFKNNPEDRAKGYQVVMEIQALAFNMVISPRMTNPRVIRALGYQTDIYSTGLPATDFHYAFFFLDGSQVYKMRGQFDPEKMFLIQTWGKHWGEPGWKESWNYEMSDMEVGPDGTFEITLGGPKQKTNWIPLVATSDYQPFTIRRQVIDWGEDMGELTIERVSPIEEGHYDRDEFDLKAQAKRIRRATDYIRWLGHTYAVGLYQISLDTCNGVKNVMCLWQGAGKQATGATAVAHYIAGITHLEEDEALLIEVDEPPKTKYWSFQLGDVWGRALPFYEKQVGLSMNDAAIDSDGKIRVVLSHKDPGLVNWIDTAGRKEGLLLYRNYFPEAEAVLPKITKVKFAELDALLPKDSKRISAEERKKKLEIHRKNVYRVMDE